MASMSLKRLLSLSAAAAVATITLWAADPIPQLGISEAQANQALMSAITAGNWPYGAPATAVKKLSGSARGVLVQELGAWAKATASSAAFRTAYAADRMRQAPQAPTFEGTVEEEFKRRQEKQAAEIARSRKNLEKLPPDLRKGAEAALKQSEDLMNTPAMLKTQLDAVAFERRQAEERYKEALARWQTSYPEDPNGLIAKQLRRFLDTTADVDFGAALVSERGRMRFANPQYEQKSGDWKACFRAGREAVSAGRTLATAWLKEIGG